MSEHEGGEAHKPYMGFIDFSKRVGIVAGALLAVITLSNTLGGVILRQAMVPISLEISRQVERERVARVEADEKLTISLREISTSLSSDRMAILSILEYPIGPERSRQVRRIRALWDQRVTPGQDDRATQSRR